MSNQKLLRLARSERAPIPIEESLPPVRAIHPGPVWVTADVGHTHIPIGKLEINDAGPDSQCCEQPISGAIVPVTRDWRLSIEGRNELAGCLEGDQFVSADELVFGTSFIWLFC